MSYFKDYECKSSQNTLDDFVPSYQEYAECDLRLQVYDDDTTVHVSQGGGESIL